MISSCIIHDIIILGAIQQLHRQEGGGGGGEKKKQKEKRGGGGGGISKKSMFGFPRIALNHFITPFLVHSRGFGSKLAQN